MLAQSITAPLNIAIRQGKVPAMDADYEQVDLTDANDEASCRDRAAALRIRSRI
jgi:hypothetical protein